MTDHFTAPSFWWDFNGRYEVEVFAKWRDQTFKAMANGIEDAEKLIADLRAGRRTLKDVFQCDPA